MKKRNSFYDVLKKIDIKENKHSGKNWYGIPSIKFIWNGTWLDPEIEYNGCRCSCYIVEDAMWNRWTHNDNGEIIKERLEDYEGFNRYMLENVSEVEALAELAMREE